MHIRSARLRVAALALGVVLGTTGLTACSALFPSAPPPVDSTTGDEIDVKTTDVFAVEVGDCFNDAPGTTVSELPVINCADEHDYEVYGEFTLTQSSFPGDSVIDELADERCGELFSAFVGIAYDESELQLASLTPTSQSWSSGDRIVSCLITDPAGKTIGSLRNAAR